MTGGGCRCADIRAEEEGGDVAEAAAARATFKTWHGYSVQNFATLARSRVVTFSPPSTPENDERFAR